MATLRQVRTWIEQAEADLAASRVIAVGIAECHARYLLQQSYEKAIKAYALLRWTGSPAEEPELAKLFLLQHSPLKRVGQASTPLSKPLALLAREVEAFVRRIDGAGLLRQIDATTPRNEPGEVSYRYPFLVDGEYLAPSAYRGWDAYQGNALGAQSAVDRLLKAVRKEQRSSANSPR